MSFETTSPPTTSSPALTWERITTLLLAIFLPLFCYILSANYKDDFKSPTFDFASAWSIASCYICTGVFLLSVELVGKHRPLLRTAILLLALGKAIVIPFYLDLGTKNSVLPGFGGILLLVSAVLLRCEPSWGVSDENPPVKGVIFVLALLIGVDSIVEFSSRLLTHQGNDLKAVEQTIQLTRTVIVDCIGYFYLWDALRNFGLKDRDFASTPKALGDFFNRTPPSASTWITTWVTRVCVMYASSEIGVCLWYWIYHHNSNDPMPWPFLLLFGSFKVLQCWVFCRCFALPLVSDQGKVPDWSKIDNKILEAIQVRARLPARLFQQIWNDIKKLRKQ